MKTCEWCKQPIKDHEPVATITDVRGDKHFHLISCWPEHVVFHEEVRKLLGWEVT